MIIEIMYDFGFLAAWLLVTKMGLSMGLVNALRVRVHFCEKVSKEDCWWLCPCSDIAVGN